MDEPYGPAGGLPRMVRRGPAFTNAPAGFINMLGDVPTDGTHPRNPADAAIYLITAGTKRQLTWDEWQ
jgi:hypothetical protein